MIPKQLQNPEFRFILLKPKSKVPIQNQWQNKNNYSYNDPQLQQHLASGGNFGIVCGYNNLVVIDFDSAAALEKLSPLLPSTFTIRTGTGLLHCYYSVDNPENLKIFDEEKNTLIDIQGKGKQVVCAGSQHPNGNYYSVQNDVPITNLTMAEIKSIIASVYPQVIENAVRKKVSTTTIKQTSEIELIKSKVSIPELLSGYNISTNKNPTGCLFHSSKGEKCLSFKEDIWYCFHCEEGGDIFNLVMLKENLDFKDAKKWLINKFHLAGIANEIKKEIAKENIAHDNIIKAFQEKDKQQGIYILAQYILQNYRIITVDDTDEILIYNEGVYDGGGDKVLSAYIQKILEKLSGIHVINEVLGHVRRLTFTKRENLLEPKNKICLQNGILNLDTLEIEKYASNIIFLNKLPVRYDKDLDCPAIKQFLREIVPEDSISILQEFSGYCLLKDYPIHKAMMLVGTGCNGKSTFINLLKQFLGHKNCVSIPLQQLENNRFAASSLFGKLVNMFADLPSRALKETSLFKMLTGEDLIPAERKFKDQFFFTNHAKQMFSCNQIPRSPDDSDAFFRRWIIINFPNQFLNNADKNILKKLTTPEELSGFLNFAIDGLRILLQQGDFSNSKSINEIREDYIRQSDSVGAFIMDCVKIKPEDYIEKKKLYTTYTDYCRQHNYPIVPENTFHRDLQMRIRVEDYQPSLKDSKGKFVRPRCWRGIFVDLNGKKGVLAVPPVQENEQAEQLEHVEQVNFHLSPSFVKEEKVQNE